MQMVIRWLHYLLITALGGLLVGIAIDDTFGRRVVGWLLEDVLSNHPGRFTLAGLGIGLLAAQALLLVRWLSLRRYAREINYANEFGKISVSLVAIEEALTRAIENEPGVRRVALRVYEDRVKRSVVIEPVLTLWENHNVTAINHRCQELLRSRFAELMPERTQVQVNLTLHRLNQRSPLNDRGRRKSRASTAEHHAEGEAATDDHEQTAEYDQGAGEQDHAPASSSPLASIHERPSGRLPVQQQHSPPPSPLAKSLSDDDDDLDYANLYAGPTYPVDRDEDDEGDLSDRTEKQDDSGRSRY